MAAPRFGRLTQSNSGIAALEFALIAPVMVALMMGTIELTNAIRVRSRLNTTVGQLAELVAGTPTVTAANGTLADMCTGAIMNLAPFNTSTLAADIVSLINDHPSNRVAGSTDSTTVNTYLSWENISSCPLPASGAMGLSGAVALANAPLSLLTGSGTTAAGGAGSSLEYGASAIVVKVTYTYANILPIWLGTSITFSAVALARPRTNTEIQCTNTAGTQTCPLIQ
jgi:Flp pilus assembly protein TadG